MRSRTNTVSKPWHLTVESARNGRDGSRLVRRRSCSGPPRLMAGTNLKAFKENVGQDHHDTRGLALHTCQPAERRRSELPIAKHRSGSVTSPNERIRSPPTIPQISLSSHFTNKLTLAIKSPHSSLKLQQLTRPASPWRRDVAYLANLPTELLWMVTEYMTVGDLLHLACVSRRFYTLAQRATLWSTIDAQALAGTPMCAVKKAICGYGQHIKSLDLSQRLDVDDHMVSLLSRNSKSLQRLCLQGCLNVSDAGFTELVACTSLTHLNLAGCLALSDHSLCRISEACSDLKHLNLMGCQQIQGQGLWLLSSLESICLDACAGISPNYLQEVARQCRHISVLSLSACAMIDDETLETFATFSSQLRCLNLSLCCLITDDGIARITSACTQLADICLAGCCLLTDKSAEHIAESTSAWRVDLSINLNITDRSLTHLSALGDRLASLNVSSCSQITGPGLCKLVQSCPGLLQLDISGCFGLNRDSILALRHCRKLKSLNLAGLHTLTKGTVAHLLAAFPELLELLLYACDIDDESLALIAGCCPNLRRLDVSYCQSITDAGLISVFKRCTKILQISCVGSRVAAIKQAPFMNPACIIVS